MISPFSYKFICGLVRFGFFFWHPVFRVEGRENIPEGPCVICSNHKGLADPLWTLLALREPKMIRIMAKDELFHVPVLKHILKWGGVICVKRGEADLSAVRDSFRALKNGEKLLIYPEGTRVHDGEHLEGKTGAVMLANRAHCPILPMYIKRRRFPFSSMKVVLGKTYEPKSENRHPTAEELHRLTDEMMDKIYTLGADVG